MELLAGTAASLVYDIAYGKSPDVRSEQNASDVTSGGTSSGKNGSYPLSKKQVKRLLDPSPKYDYNPCRKGYVPRLINGRWHCVKK